MTTFSQIQYAQYIYCLSNLYEQNDLTLSKNEEAQQLQDPLVRNILLKLPGSIQLKEMVEKISQFSKKKLFLIAAAIEANLISLAETLLERWIEKVKITNKSNSTLPKNIHVLIEFIFDQLLGKKEMTLVEPHRIFDRLNPLPKNIKKILTKRNLDQTEKELLSPYQSLIKTIHFPNPKAVENIDVATILKRYPNLEVLDLTYCFQVSSTSFLNGHKTLKYLIANGTSILESNIDKKIFPALKMVRQNDLKNVYYLSENFTFASLQSCEQIVVHSSFYKTFTFHNNQSINDCFKMVKDLIPLAHKVYFFPNFRIHLIQQLIALWKTWIESHFDEKISMYALKTFLQIRKEEPLLKDSIENAIKETFSLCTIDANGDFKPKEISKFLYHHICFLIRCISQFDWIDKEALALEYQQQIPTLRKRLFSQNNSLSIVEIMDQLFTELSYHVPLKTSEYFSILPVDLAKETLKNNEYRASNLYEEYVYSALACAFISHSKSCQDREALLKHILDHFKFTTTKSFFVDDLRDCILGLEPIAWTPFLLRERIESSHGIFLETVSEEIKNLYWKALEQGQFGGKDTGLVVDLCKFYKKNKVHPKLQKIVLNILNSLKQKSTDPHFKSFVQKKINNLNNEDSLTFLDPAARFNHYELNGWENYPN